MTQKKLAGKRCRSIHHIVTHEGTLRRDTYGTIRHAMDNLGRQLVFVSWDTGFNAYVFPAEIELVVEEEIVEECDAA